MKKWATLFLCLIVSLAASAQLFSEETGKTYALVVGISDYEDTRITDLQFAHRDAQIFYNYLISKAGGSVPTTNITFLLNQDASHAAIYDGLYQLKQKAQKGDKVLIYFSGHGDVETADFDELGYLLAYDTPFNNYRNNALRIEDLNLDARTLTLKKEAQVIFFLDACHSGELAGVNNAGPAMSARELKKKSAKEIRLMSCEPEQKSLEMANLDNGRGLFSYYLIKGLMGEANSEADATITVDELRTYVRDSVRAIAKLNNKKQVPIIEGGKDEDHLAFIDDATFKRFQTESIAAFDARPETEVVSMAATAALAEPDNITEEADDFIEPERMQSKGIAPNEHSENTTVGETEDELLTTFKTTLYYYDLLDTADNSAYSIYQSLLAKEPNDLRLSTMKSALIVALQEKAQSAINAYLRGDYEELSRRMYVDQANIYEKYPHYLEMAAKLAGSDYPTYHAIKAKQYYFAGINYRLANLMASATRTDEQIDEALRLQQQALEWDDKAAYIHNEIGILKNLAGDQTAALEKFNYALQIAPTWVIPASNIAGMYFAQKNLMEAEKWATKTIELNETFHKGNLLLGRIRHEQGNLLAAEQYFRKALLDNWLDYQSFEALAYHYTLLGDYRLADHLFKEAEFRKEGLYEIMSDYDGAINSLESVLDGVSFFDEMSLLQRIKDNPDDYQAWHALGAGYADEDRLEESEACYLQVIRIKPDEYQVYHGLGDLYKKWNRYNDAIDTYRTGLDMLEAVASPENAHAGSILNFARSIYNTLETLERNEEAEDMIRKYDFSELRAFYSRMILAYPDDPNYWYKRGLWVYNTNQDRDIFVNYSDGETWNSYYGNAVIIDFEQTLALAPEHPSKEDIYLKIGELYGLLGELYLDAVFNEERMKTEGIVVRGTEQYQHYKDFVRAYRNSIKNTEANYQLQPEQLRATHTLIDSYFRIFEPARAVELLEKLKEDGFLDIHTRRQLTSAYALSGQFELAEATLDFALQKNIGPNQLDHRTASLLYQLKGEYSKSFEQFERALQHYDQSQQELPEGEKHYKKATLQALAGQERKAIKNLGVAFENGFTYKKVVDYDPALSSLRESNAFKRLITKHDMANDSIFDE